MGWLKKAVVGRWLGRWILRGGPWSIAAKLLGVVAWGAWKWRREAKRVEEERRSREIPAEYEVLEERGGAPAEGREIPPREEHGRRGPGTIDREPDDDSIRTTIPSPTPEDRPGGQG